MAAYKRKTITRPPSLVETAKRVEDRLVFIERAVFGWIDDETQKRHQGLLEKVDGIFIMVRLGVTMLVFVVAHNLGVPTEKLAGWLGTLLGHAAGN